MRLFPDECYKCHIPKKPKKGYVYYCPVHKRAMFHRFDFEAHMSCLDCAKEYSMWYLNLKKDEEK